MSVIVIQCISNYLCYLVKEVYWDISATHHIPRSMGWGDPSFPVINEERVNDMILLRRMVFSKLIDNLYCLILNLESWFVLPFLYIYHLFSNWNRQSFDDYCGKQWISFFLTFNESLMQASHPCMRFSYIGIAVHSCWKEKSTWANPLI